MGRIDQLLENYRKQLALPLRPGLPLTQRVWFAVYPPEEERRTMNRIDEFEIATREAGLNWIPIELSGAFADWLDTFEPEERDQCLRSTDILEAYADPGFRDFLCSRIAGVASTAQANDRCVFAVKGLMDLYDFVHVSAVVDGLEKGFPGILLVFFPGEREGNTYRFLGARTGWNYLAVPILSES